MREPFGQFGLERVIPGVSQWSPGLNDARVLGHRAQRLRHGKSRWKTRVGRRSKATRDGRRGAHRRCQQSTVGKVIEVKSVRRKGGKRNGVGSPRTKRLRCPPRSTITYVCG